MPFLHILLQTGLVVFVRFVHARLFQQANHVFEYHAPRMLQPAVKIDRAEDSLQCVRDNRGFVAPAGELFAVAKAQVRGDFKGVCRAKKRAFANKPRAVARHRALLHTRLL